MHLSIICKISKRFRFEINKKYKKIKHFLLREYVSNLQHGSFQERNIITNDLELLSIFYRNNHQFRVDEISDANRILEGEYNLLYFNNNVNINGWNIDFESGYIYKIRYHGDINYIVNDEKTDVKNVWELSRFHHLVIVAKAYFITSDDKYYHYFKNQIISWLAENPNGHSVNWTCNMEVAIRVINIIIAFNLVKSKLEKDDEFKKLLKATVYYHNKHIFENLENYSENRNNHYLANLMGLLVSSKFIEEKNLSKYRRYQLFARLELEKEVEKQIYSDGVTYEISTSYQKLVFEILLLSLILGQSKGNMFSNKYVSTLSKMFAFLKMIKNQDDSIPLIGDNDSGNILVFNDYFNPNRTNLRSIIDLSEYYFSDKSQIKNSLTSFIGVKTDSNTYRNDKRLSYQDSGYYILKNEIFKMIVLCGPLSMKGQGGHSHNDQLSFVLNINNKPIFIDPGTISYTGNKELRNHSRKTSSHNTVQVGDEEQNLIGSDLFSMSERTYSKCTNFSQHEFSGFHSGFKEKYGCIHKRYIKIEDGQIIISDKLLDEYQREINGKLHLVIADYVKISQEGKFITLVWNGGCLLTNIKSSDCSISDMRSSDRYGRYYTTKKITYEFSTNNELIMKLK
ncbi:alginate lyase family protein [Vibrio vulnificus]|uniref:alginate lyase family protein n=1 Tax=Vibrio vulnificus TaxID=672 RepID=UPI000CD014A1|nr:alginate lyase family protein [Vibrio vulnificus]EHU4977154.1 alginate lyase family protein [Vibrio vulnificus]EJV9308458.1 alginate lyase family protein [Vibrio vulnificus]ELO5513295.1 alginate lyase family protein [Vibrio vulnificus]MCU8447897.1 heparinase II/III family protein [Vibrio vulnificus]POC38358.1 hypothetical protein CRN38_07035 [Vibrio vulnificus]